MDVELTKHYLKRASERLNGVDPEHLAEAFCYAIETNHQSVTYEGRFKYKSEVVRRFSTSTDGDKIVVVITDEDPNVLRFITVYIDDGRNRNY